MPNLWEATRTYKKIEEFMRIRAMIAEYGFERSSKITMTAHYSTPIELEVTHLEWREFIAEKGVKLANELKEAGVEDSTLETFIFTWGRIKEENKK
jgi:hypothetical protein